MKRFSFFLYNILIITIFVFLVFYAFQIENMPVLSPEPLPLFLLLLLSTMGEIWIVKMPRWGIIPVSHTFYYVLMCRYGVFYTLVVSSISALARACLTVIKKAGTGGNIKSADNENIPFHFLHTPLIFLAGSIVYQKLSLALSSPPERGDIVGNIQVLFLVSIFCGVGKHILHSFYLYIINRSPLSSIYKIELTRAGLYLITLVPLSLLITVILSINSTALFLLLPTLILAWFSVKRYSDLVHETRSTMEVLAETVEARDPYMIDHSERVARYSRDIAIQLRLPPETVEQLESAARMHDLGKVSIQDRILGKLEPLDEHEVAVIKKHPLLGEKMAKHLSSNAEASLMIKHHHERYDGKGYPDRIAGDRIPLGARIIAVAETFDVLTTDKSYGEAISFKQALDEIRQGSGTQFDPMVVEAFHEAMKNRISKFEG